MTSIAVVTCYYNDQLVINCTTAARHVKSLVVLWHENSKLNLIFDQGDGTFQTKKIMCAPGEHYRRYAHAIRLGVGLHSTQKFHPIVNYKHYQISSGARASLANTPTF